MAGLPELLTELGVSLEAAFAGSGIAPDALVPEARFPMPALMGLLERSSQVADCPHLGLLLGSRCDHRALGAMGEMMTRAPTLGDAFRDYVGLQLGYSRAAVVYLQRAGDDYLIGYGLYEEGNGVGRQVYDLVLAIGCNMVRNLTGGRAKPVRTLLCSSPPLNAAPYRNILKTPVLFDQEQTCIVVSAGDMAGALPTADPAARQHCREAIQKMARGDLDDMVARVRHALRPRLMIGEADRECVARDLGLGPRTLARHLAAAGTSFELLRDEVRYTVARELLLLTRLPIGRVGEALSYTTNSAFNHAFRRWAGTSPSRWRRQQRADG